MSRRSAALSLGTAMLSVFVFTTSAVSQEEILSQETYLTPPPQIAELVLAPWSNNVSLSNLSPDGRYFLKTISDGLPPIANFAKKFYRLGGEQIDPEANRDRSNTLRSSVGIELIDAQTMERHAIQIPRGARVSNPSWSPDGSKLAYYAHFEDATHIYVADPENGRSTQITPRRQPVMNTLHGGFEWTGDGQSILVTLVPRDRDDPPVEPEVPTHPMVRMTEEGENKLRVYASLLEDPYEMALLEYYTTTQLALINVNNRRVTPIGEPDMIRSTDMSPSGQHMRVTTMEKPFSYIVPVGNFGSTEEVWDLEGEALTELSSRELRTGIQGQEGAEAPQQPRGRGGGGGGDRSGRRSLSWRPDGAGFSFLQLEPRERGGGGGRGGAGGRAGGGGRGGQPQEQPEEQQEEEEPRPDRVMLWTAPFDTTDVTVVYQTDTQMSSVSYSEDMQTLFITERDGGTERLYAVYLDDPETQYTIYEHDTEDRLEAPGRLMSTRNDLGASVVQISTDGRFVFLSGTQNYEDPLENAPRPFLDKVEIRNGENIQRLWQSGEDAYETLSEVLDDDASQIIIARESPTMVRDYYQVDTATGQERKLTDNRDYAPQITNTIKHRFRVTRVDGFSFWVNVTLPPDWREGQRLPAMFWFYPREYTSQDNYDEGDQRYNKNRFSQPGTRSMVYLTTLGYALVEPDCPIVGTETDNRNDNYTTDLLNNLYAVIDDLDKKGYIDRDRLAIGGHSYGAFGTANAMIRTPFFKAGIAGDGNYNRMLTPMGFQSERRELWEAREVYLSMSPLLWANQLNGALLMYHGMDDQNTGTAPFHAPKMFAALNGLGKTAALYMYPYEDHGPASRETNLDLWARWIAWLDKYVMNYGQETETETQGRRRRGGGL